MFIFLDSIPTFHSDTNIDKLYTFRCQWIGNGIAYFAVEIQKPCSPPDLLVFDRLTRRHRHCQTGTAAVATTLEHVSSTRCTHSLAETMCFEAFTDLRLPSAFCGHLMLLK